MKVTECDGQIEQTLAITPATKKVTYQPEARARVRGNQVRVAEGLPWTIDSLTTGSSLARRVEVDLHDLVPRVRRGAIPKCGHVALVLEYCYVNICVIFSSSGPLRMRLISRFSRASGARFSETDDSPETVVGRWILPAKLKALLGSSPLLSQMVPGKYLMAESKSPLFGITPRT